MSQQLLVAQVEQFHLMVLTQIKLLKVGRMVTVTGFIIVSSVSSPVGYYTISLPFTCANLTDSGGRFLCKHNASLWE